MADIPAINIEDFKKLKASQIREMKSVEVTENGEYVFTAVIPPTNGGSSVTDNIRIEALRAAFKGNTIGGKDPKDVQS